MRRGTRLLLLVTGTMAAALLLPRLPRALSGMELFRVVTVSVEGNRFLEEEEVVAAAALPEGANLWDETGPILARLREHPAVREARVLRRPPGRLHIEVTEREPVALLPNPTLTPVDAEGRLLPIDPAVHRLDLPLLHPRRDPVGKGPPLTATQIRALVSELDLLGRMDPELLATVSDIAFDRWGDVVVRLDAGVTLHYRAPLTLRRLREGLLVLADAGERYAGRPPIGVDLRFADQVVLRLAPRRNL